jgi:hypothetical protein
VFHLRVAAHRGDAYALPVDRDHFRRAQDLVRLQETLPTHRSNQRLCQHTYQIKHPASTHIESNTLPTHRSIHTQPPRDCEHVYSEIILRTRDIIQQKRRTAAAYDKEGQMPTACGQNGW